ncbi:hypothetical protein HJC23_011104 [Cyclotella cryptica]|uniref:Uncharacterized protein n=1 Tax=Cyclotella cryptica TaxID=29204 RepID=A0ABD3P585_9STRA|eukprot:CCRYP_017299-RA/>CCRYP_017299-RA protein AED:0.27 eAED:0.27 QI:0/-1/0/1/-1/1/1/0/184
MFESESPTPPMSPHDDGASHEQTMNEVHPEYRRRSTHDVSYAAASHHGKKHPQSNSEGCQQSWAETDWEELVKIWTREIMTTSAEQLSSLSSSDEFRENYDAGLDDHGVASGGRMRESDLLLLSLGQNWGAADEAGGILEDSNESHFDKSQHVERNFNLHCQEQSKTKGRLQNRLWLSRRRCTV